MVCDDNYVTGVMLDDKFETKSETVFKKKFESKFKVSCKLC